MGCVVVAPPQDIVKDVGHHDDTKKVLIVYSDSIVKLKLLTERFNDNSKAEVDGIFSCGARSGDLRVCTSETSLVSLLTSLLHGFDLTYVLARRTRAILRQEMWHSWS